MKKTRSIYRWCSSHLTAEKLLFAGSALLSLVFVTQYLSTLPMARAEASSIKTAVATAGIKDAPVAANQTAPAALAPAGVATVVTKALAFKALLTSAQQATLEQTYTTALAGRWSNLPNQLCGGCRNGLQFSTLSAAQLAAAKEVIAAAAGTTANEGAAEFNQILLADTYLSANGGGSTYGEGNYFIAFLNTPSTTGAWLLQFGGHHYAANIAFNQGHVVGATPQHEAVEPLSFTSGGTTYSPLAQEREALAALLASLSATQLASAKVTTTFNDCVMLPGASTGGPSSFPTTKIGLAVSSLSSAQKQLVLAAMKPWVQDADDTVAANLLKIYESELDSTYLAFTGNGTAGDASSFLNASSNYARIDGPSAWIEFACQGGIVIRNQIHYHTIWRDRNRDYGKDLSLTVPLDNAAVATVTTTSAASFAAGALAPEAIGAVFGTGLAAGNSSATTTTLPTTLAGVQIQVTDAAGTTRNAPLFFVSPSQINFQLPPATGTGTATLTVLRDGTAVGQGTLQVEAVTPGLFAANANGQGIAAAVALRVKADGTQSFEPVAQYNTTTSSYEAVPLDFGTATDQLFLVSFGTGLRYRSALSAVTATVGGTSASVSFAGAQGSLTGVDQVNLALARTLAGRGNVNVVVTADAKTANTVTINFK